MLIRSILQLSSRRAVPRSPRNISTTQIPKFHQKEFSTKSNPNQSGKPADSGGGSASKIIIGSAFVGAATFAMYRTGYLDQFLGGNDRNESPKPIEVGIPKNHQDSKDVSQHEDQSALPDSKEANESSASFAVNESVEETETLPGHSIVAASIERIDGVEAVGQDKLEVRHDESDVSGEEKNSVDYSRGGMISDDQSLKSGLSLSSEASPEPERTTNKEEITEKVSEEEVQTPPVFSQSDEAVEKVEEEVVPHVNLNLEEIDEPALDEVVENPVSLLDEYNLEDADESSYKSLHQHDDNNIDLLAAEKEALSSALEELGDAYISKDGKLVLDFLEAIHAAESRQAELDARMYASEKKSLKDKYEKELKDAAIRELMLAEEAAMLDKDLKRERTKAAAALKSLQEQLEEKYKNELEQKKRAAEMKLKKAEELAKVELAAKIASEKAAQIEKIAEANLHINALCMAFYARSEEARRSHSAHKLALGALALEDALSKGLPIQTEIGALRKDLDGIDKDSILDLVLSSLPDETRNNGTDTLLQLNQKFDALKGTLRHYSLIPPGGGGILAHSVARVASWLKVKETSESGEGIESLISKIDSCLADGKIAEAAEALEEGVRGTQASEIVGDWVRRARDRAITEQALTLLQSYATSVSAS